MTSPTHPTSSPTAQSSSRRARALLAGVVGLAALVILPAVAQAAVRPAHLAAARVSRAAAERPSFSAASCVSKATVSRVVGWSVPAPTAETLNLPATAKNDHIASKQSDCVYGDEESLAGLAKLVILEVGTTSKPLTSLDLPKLIDSAEKAAPGSHYTFKPYSGLGTAAWYFDIQIGQFQVRGIAAARGTTLFGSSCESPTLAISKLAALAKLAEGM
ncbi:MAG TPA: hypothetical protein VMD59_06335 [Acidimicrobiales bacterium]|nr:hypothetical protein [Acidimicrobiales bacterium]